MTYRLIESYLNVSNIRVVHPRWRDFTSSSTILMDRDSASTARASRLAFYRSRAARCSLTRRSGLSLISHPESLLLVERLALLGRHGTACGANYSSSLGSSVNSWHGRRARRHAVGVASSSSSGESSRRRRGGRVARKVLVVPIVAVGRLGSSVLGHFRGLGSGRDTRGDVG